MKKIILFGFIICLFTLLVACSVVSQKTASQAPHAQNIQLISQNNLKDWKANLTPRLENNSQIYDLEVEYVGDAPIQNGTLFLRVDTKEKLKGKIIKPDQAVQVSKIEPHMILKIIGLTLAEDTPIRFGLQWVERNQALMGDGTFVITPTK